MCAQPFNPAGASNGLVTEPSYAITVHSWLFADKHQWTVSFQPKPGAGSRGAAAWLHPYHGS